MIGLGSSIILINVISVPKRTSSPTEATSLTSGSGSAKSAYKSVTKIDPPRPLLLSLLLLFPLLLPLVEKKSVIPLLLLSLLLLPLPDANPATIDCIA